MKGQWFPATPVEERLWHAVSAGSQHEYLQVLADGALHCHIEQAKADEVLAGLRTGDIWLLMPRRRMGRQQVQLYTLGELPDGGPGEVPHYVSLGYLANPGRRTKYQYTVNPGTPLEKTFTEETLSMWATQHGVRGFADNHHDKVVTNRRCDLSGPLAHGMACGAHLAVRNGVPWNQLGDTYYGAYISDVNGMRESWGVWDKGQWAQQMDALLGRDGGYTLTEFALQLRTHRADETGAEVGFADWRSIVLAKCSAMDVNDETAERLLAVMDRIIRYEDRFRSDGLLAPTRFVRSALAWHLGRSVNVARWGLGARYCDRVGAAQLILQAGQKSQEYYTSWFDFSAGYVLGRVLHFDEDKLGDWYQTVLTGHRILVSDPQSPWLNLEFKPRT